MEEIITIRIQKLASHYARPNRQIDADDLTQVGLIAAWKAEASWRADRGARLTTWQQRHAHRAIIDELRRQQRHRRQVEVNDEIDQSYEINPDESDYFDYLAKVLSGRELELANLVARGYSCMDAQELLGICQQRISQLKADIRHKFETHSEDFLGQISANSHN